MEFNEEYIIFKIIRFWCWLIIIIN